MRTLYKYLPYVFFCLLVVVRVSSLPADMLLSETRISNDLTHYIKISESLLDGHNDFIPRTYQYPLFYPILLLPGILLNNVRHYVIILDTILSLLVCAITLLFMKKYIVEPYASISSFGIISLNLFLVPIKGFGYPIMICTLLFIIMMYLLLTDKNLFYPSACFALLVAASFVSLFLIAFVFLFLLFIKYTRIKQTLLFFLPASCIFIMHCLYNMLNHGISYKGAIGGYTSVTQVFWMHWPDRLLSLFYYLEPSLIFIVLILICIACYIVVKSKNNWSRLSILLAGNMIFFLFVPGMLWDLDYIAWRYPCFMVQTYIILAVIMILSSRFTNCDRGWRADG